MKTIAKCITTEIGHRIFRAEEGKEISFVNNEYEIVCDVVPIENCVFGKKVGGKRCDYLFLFDKLKQTYNILKTKKSIAYYVELKGTELIEGCEQLLNSITETRDEIPNFEIFPIVVSSHEFVPSIHNNEFARDLQRLIKKNIRFEITPFTIVV